jgi:hypothetical protein
LSGKRSAGDPGGAKSDRLGDMGKKGAAFVRLFFRGLKVIYTRKHFFERFEAAHYEWQWSGRVFVPEKTTRWEAEFSGGRMGQDMSADDCKLALGLNFWVGLPIGQRLCFCATEGHREFDLPEVSGVVPCPSEFSLWGFDDAEYQWWEKTHVVIELTNEPGKGAIVSNGQGGILEVGGEVDIFLPSVVCPLTAAVLVHFGGLSVSGNSLLAFDGGEVDLLSVAGNQCAPKDLAGWMALILLKKKLDNGVKDFEKITKFEKRARWWSGLPLAVRDAIGAECWLMRQNGLFAVGSS